MVDTPRPLSIIATPVVFGRRSVTEIGTAVNAYFGLRNTGSSRIDSSVRRQGSFASP